MGDTLHVGIFKKYFQKFQSWIKCFRKCISEKIIYFGFFFFHFNTDEQIMSESLFFGKITVPLKICIDIFHTYEKKPLHL